MAVTTASLWRTVQIWTPDNSDTGAGFTIDWRDRQWLITASHLVRGFDATKVKVVTSDAKTYEGLEHVPTDDSSDIAVFSLFNKQLTRRMLLKPTSTGVSIGQRVFMHGFPFGWSVPNGEERLPFTKTAALSGSTRTVEGKQLWIFDGMGLEGFSGGPIVFENLKTHEWHVMGVASNYQTVPVVVHDAFGDAVGHARTNSGFFLGFDIAIATQAIDEFLGVHGEQR